MSKSNKTLGMNVDGKEILIANLPKPIRDNVDLFDRVRADMDELSYELTILNHAGISLNNRILVDAAEYLKALKEAEEAQEAENVGEEVENVPKLAKSKKQ